MMNFQDTLDDMSTLAHEYGHAVHCHLAMTHQPYRSFRYVPFLAEIASTCNEALLNDYLLSTPRQAERRDLLVERLENIRTTIYRQTMFAEFELAVHAMVEDGTPITASLLDQTYRDLLRAYYGPDYTIDDNDGMEWAYIPHFYYKYYVFTYATGLSSGIAIAERVRGLGEPADADLGMLRGGARRRPSVAQGRRRRPHEARRPPGCHEYLRPHHGSGERVDREVAPRESERETDPEPHAPGPSSVGRGHFTSTSLPLAVCPLASRR